MIKRGKLLFLFLVLIIIISGPVKAASCTTADPFKLTFHSSYDSGIYNSTDPDSLDADCGEGNTIATHSSVELSTSN